MKQIVWIGGAFLLGLGVMWFVSSLNMNMSHMGMGGMRGGMENFEGGLTELSSEDLEFVKPTEIIELTDGDVFEMKATIVKQEVGNRIIKRLAYNGQIPGPVLKVKKGSKITVNFTNNIDMETALHSHGLRGDWKFDGAVPITPPVEIGETFSYELEFPDTGVYWYHPHVREDYQQELGLYGNMIVEEEGYWSEVKQEEYLILDDFLEDGDFDVEVVSKALMGRFGNVLLINDSSEFEVSVTEGEITRFFLTNVANTRTFDVLFEGGRTKLVGGDIGRIENEAMIESTIIAPAERYILEVLYSDSGTYPIMHRGEKIGTVNVVESTSDESVSFAQLRANIGDYADLRNAFSVLLDQTPDKELRLAIEMNGVMGGGGMMNDGGMMEEGDEAMMREHCQMMPEMEGCESSLEEDEHEHEHNHDPENHGGERGMGMGNKMMGDEEDHGSDGIEWEDDMAMMNNMSTNEIIEWIIEDTATGARNGDIDWTFSEGDMVKVRIFNDPTTAHPMQHPIHFHGQRFVVLSRDGVASDNLQWKDTTLVRKGETVDILIDMSNAGKWMAHCHIAEHLHTGMMFNFDVE